LAKGLNIKNAQIAEALNLGGIKGKLKLKKRAGDDKAKEENPKKAAAKKPAAKKTAAKKPAAKKATTKKATTKKAATKKAPPEETLPAEEVVVEERPRVKARSKSVFDEEEAKAAEIVEETPEPPAEEVVEVEEVVEEVVEVQEPVVEPEPEVVEEPVAVVEEPVIEKEAPKAPSRPKLGPTGRHINDLLPKPKPVEKKKEAPSSDKKKEGVKKKGATDTKGGGKGKAADLKSVSDLQDIMSGKKGTKPPFKEFRDIKPRRPHVRSFDSRDKHGLRESTDSEGWRRRRRQPRRSVKNEEAVVRPTELSVRLPISLKDLAAEMKLKAAQLISKLFMQGVAVTLNDFLDDETTVKLLGDEFGCAITIDTSEEERIRVTGKTIKEEIDETEKENLELRPPVVVFMGHVDHGKTSLIDVIRKSNIVAGEAGAITQHIGAFRCKTDVGDITILDTPGHEAFSAMRARGAEVTDIVVLVVAGDEGIRQQTDEAIQHAKASGCPIVVAVNKNDKPGFDLESTHRQLADHDLLPEAWGGQTITVPCSAVTEDGVNTLLEMLSLQSEVLELKADPKGRARGTVLESEMHKGFGIVATVLVQNGTLNHGDALVFNQYFGRVKTMGDENGKNIQQAGPSTPVAITGLSGIPEAGEEFIVVGSEKEAKDIAEARGFEQREKAMQKKALSMENIFQEAGEGNKKVLNVILRADVQGSAEALKVSLQKLESDKVDLNVVGVGVGEVSESDVQLAAASKAVILGFHTEIESHAEPLIKQYGVTVRMHDIIYHAIDDVKALMTGMLDKIAEEKECSKSTVQAVFKSSQHGVIAGCIVNEGTLQRNHLLRLVRGTEVVWKGTASSLRRVKDDVREVKNGLECGVVINTNDIEEGDIIESYEIVYHSQQL